MSEAELLNKSSSSEDSYSFLVFDDAKQNPRDVKLAAKFWKQFELEPQIESRLVSKDNISQSSRKNSARPLETRGKSQPVPKSSGGRLDVNQPSISRSQTIPVLQIDDGNTRISRSSSRSRYRMPPQDTSKDKKPSVSEMVKQLKQTSKYVSTKGVNRTLPGVGEIGNEFDIDISDNETSIDADMRQLDLFDDHIAKNSNTVTSLPMY